MRRCRCCGGGRRAAVRLVGERPAQPFPEAPSRRTPPRCARTAGRGAGRRGGVDHAARRRGASRDGGAARRGTAGVAARTPRRRRSPRRLARSVGDRVRPRAGADRGCGGGSTAIARGRSGASSRRMHRVRPRPTSRGRSRSRTTFPAAANGSSCTAVCSPMAPREPSSWLGTCSSTCSNSSSRWSQPRRPAEASSCAATASRSPAPRSSWTATG